MEQKNLDRLMQHMISTVDRKNNEITRLDRKLVMQKFESLRNREESEIPAA